MAKELNGHGDFEPKNEEDAEMKVKSAAESNDEPCDRIDLAADLSTAASNPIIQDAYILNPSFRDSLIKTINKLDPASFVRLARTCRPMNLICFSTPGIEVRYGDDVRSFVGDGPEKRKLMMRVEEDRAQPEGVRFELLQQQRDRDEWPQSVPHDFIQKVSRMPFRLVVETAYFDVELEEINSRQLEAFRQYLRRFRRLYLGGVVMLSGTSDWNQLVEIVQEFSVKRFEGYDELFTEIPEDVLRFFAANLTRFEYPGYVSDDVILALKAKEACFQRARISVGTFKALLQKFAAGEIIRWDVGREVPAGDSDPFVTACSDVFTVAVLENVDFVVKDPGVLYTSPSAPEEFHLLRADGSNGQIHIQWELITFA